ncbi:MAG: hypothetical protein IT447_06510 [Phycisphaerales bacterium]|nr:hypothetical protein [Phycisphaerales bacterium]
MISPIELVKNEVGDFVVAQGHASHAGALEKGMNGGHFGGGFDESRGVGGQNVLYEIGCQPDAAKLRVDDDPADGSQMLVDPMQSLSKGGIARAEIDLSAKIARRGP